MTLLHGVLAIVMVIVGVRYVSDEFQELIGWESNTLGWEQDMRGYTRQIFSVQGDKGRDNLNTCIS